MSTAEFHYRVGRYVLERERKLGLKNKSLLAAAHEYAVPLYTSSPGDSSIGMNVAAKALQGNKLAFDPSLDVNETAAIVLAAKRGLIRDEVGTGSGSDRVRRSKRKRSGRSAIFILGGGSPKNFALQTEPQIQEVLGIDERGHDYFLQVTDARPDTGGLSGATPAKPFRGAKSIPIICLTRSCVTSIQLWRCRSSPPTLLQNTNRASRAALPTPRRIHGFAVERISRNQAEGR